MKNQTTQPRTSRRRTLWLTGGFLLVAVIAAGAAFRSSSAAARQNDPAPIIAILTHDGGSLNAASLRVQALVAAVKSRNGESFVFNGQTVAGRNAGRVRRVDLALDGILLRSIDTSEYGRQFVTDFVVDLSAINEGLHLLTINAFQGNGNNETTKSVSTTFTLDRSLVLAERNRIEEAATPKPFAGFRVRGWDGQDDDDADEEDPWQCPPRFDLKGTTMLGTQSDGIDLARDRVVVALGSQTKVLEPGMLNCNRQDKICRFEDVSQPFVRFIELKRKNDGRWKFRLRGAGPLPGVGSSLLSLRLGNDWGSIDLANGERLVGLRPNLDVSHQAQASIGAGGGTVETVDASGVIIRLEIPPDALTQDTVIKITPLLTSPLTDSSGTLHPGMKFEPEGLQFAKAATLTIDFSNASQTIEDDHSIFLFTSPMTTLPLFGATDSTSKTLTAQLYHFSAAGAGRGKSGQMDLRAWAASLLLGTDNLSISELELLQAMVVQEQRRGCTQNCLDVSQLANRASDSIGALVGALCPSSVNDPTDQALARLLQLEVLGTQMGVDTVALGLRTCAEQVFRALIDLFHGTRASIDPSENNLARLLNDMVNAQHVDFDNLETQALQRLAAAVRALAAQAQEQACAGNNTVATSMLTRALNWAPAVTTVDETLAGDIQRALDDIRLNRLSCAAMRVTLNPALTEGDGTTFLWFHRVRHFANCEQAIVTPGGTNSYGCDQIPSSAFFGGSTTTPPFSLEGQLNNTRVRVSATQPSPNVLAVDLNGTAEPADGDVGNSALASLRADITFTKAGVFDFAINTTWAEDSEFLGYFRAGLSAGNQTQVWWQSYNPHNFEQRPTGRLVVSGPTTIRLVFQVNIGQSEGGYITGSGRIITATFTPSPQP